MGRRVEALARRGRVADQEAADTHPSWKHEWVEAQEEARIRQAVRPASFLTSLVVVLVEARIQEEERWTKMVVAFWKGCVICEKHYVELGSLAVVQEEADTCRPCLLGLV